MPFMGRDVQPSRKRRWHDGDDNIFTLYHPDDDVNQDYYPLPQHHQTLPSRKILPLSKRAKFTDDIHAAPTHRRRVSQQRALQDTPDLRNRPSEKQATLNLTPCHICHRRPTKKSDLDSFAECHGCNLRTCYVCIRQCQGRTDNDSASILSEQEALSRSFIMEDVDDNNTGTGDSTALDHQQSDLDGSPYAHGAAALKDISKGWIASGHKSVVCSRCCVEKGAQGEVVCLGCLSGMDHT